MGPNFVLPLFSADPFAETAGREAVCLSSSGTVEVPYRGRACTLLGECSDWLDSAPRATRHQKHLKPSRTQQDVCQKLGSSVQAGKHGY